MSAENKRSSPLCSPTTSQQSIQTLSSEGEGEAEEGEEERSGETSPFSEEEEYLEEDEQEYLYEQENVKEKKHLQEETGPQGKGYLPEEEYLEREFKVAFSSQTPSNFNTRSPTAGISQMTTFFTVPPPISVPASKPPYYDAMPSTSFMKNDGECLAWQHKGTQTEWVYESKEYITTELTQEEEEAMELVSQENFWGSILNEPSDMLEVEDSDDNLLNSSYQSAFRAMIEEMTAQSELEEDVDIPLTGHLESESRRKLGVLLKKNFQKYKKTILWIIKKHEKIFSPKDADTSTFTFRLRNQLPQVKEPEVEVKTPRHTVHHKRKIEIDTTWIKSKMKVPQGDVELTLYPSGNTFHILFPDGSGQIHYPSGHLAMLTLCTKESRFTYVILDDSEEACVRALVNNTGHATFYDESTELWVSLSQNLGYYFAKGKPQKAWNWWDLSLHIHAPPVRPISLNINRYITVQVTSQDEITFRFVHQTKRVCLNLGTKYKFIPPELLSEMKKAALLEAGPGSTARRVHFLLGKMSRVLNFLTIPDLENFLEAAKLFLDVSMRPRERSYVPD